MSPSLSVVAHNETLLAEPAAEAPSVRIRKLQAEVKVLAREHVQALEAALLKVERLSAEIAQGGEAYPVGVRELARRLADDTGGAAMTIEAIVARAR